MGKKSTKKISGQDILEENALGDVNTVASAGDCTGLIPTPPLSEAEAESYQDIYDIPKSEHSQDDM